MSASFDNEAYKQQAPQLSYKESLILQLRRTQSMFEERILMTQKLISLAEQSPEAVEFSRIMGEMNQH